MKDENLSRAIKLKLCTSFVNDYKELEELNLTNKNFIGNDLNIDLKEIVELENLEKLSLKFFDITDEIIESINKLKKLYKLEFFMCKFKTNKHLNNNIIDLTFYCCDELQQEIYKNNLQIKKLELTKSGVANINDLEDFLNLKELKIRDCSIIGLPNISKLINLEYLFLNNIDLKYEFSIKKMKKLTYISLNGSKSFNNEQYIQNLQKQNKDIQIDWRKDDLPIY